LGAKKFDLILDLLSPTDPTDVNVTHDAIGLK
jgi:hypothetical protein